MKIEINITKTRFFILLGVIFLLGAGIFVYAYNANGLGGNPAVMGHSVDEIDWSANISKNLLFKIFAKFFVSDLCIHLQVVVFVGFK